MALSRIALIASLALPGALAAAPAAAQPDPVEEAIAAQREIVRAAVAPECGSENEEEIVVCGRAAEDAADARRFRVAPTAPEADRAGAAQRDAMAAGSERCSTVGRDQRCGGTIPILQAIGLVIRGIQAVRARRD